ncbi:MAG: bifunctional alpha,alpha-trehalose-phosphate synthase (UDP-forming)/trehalose-phosphatase [Bacteroidales bacterium]
MKENISFKRLVIVAYRLPFKYKKTKNGYKIEQSSGGLVSAILALSENFKKNNIYLKNSKILWFGTAENLPNDTTSLPSENEHFELFPVKIPKTINDLYYGGFCNDLIWPLFHYFPSLCEFNSDYYAAFEKANAMFLEELEKIIQPDDFVWIHDYQLLLLPDMLRKKIRNVNIGFFLHIPFPSFELFRLLPRTWREAIINGMLGADLVGFHTNDYTQNFIKCVKRTTGLECNQNIIYTPQRVVKADAFPIGIDYEKFRNASQSPRVLKWKQKIKHNFTNQKLIFSVDRLDYSKGLMLRLKGYETFLEKYPQWHAKIVFVMVVVPSRDFIEKYKNLKKEIESTVSRINGKYGTLTWHPIIYQYRSLPFDELVALYSISDIALITPLRDGMNLVAKEFIACQTENQGCLILSEMAGAAAELNEALIINPVDNFEIADAIFSALEMNQADKKMRLARMQNRIANYNVFTWAQDFFKQSLEIKQKQNKMNVRIIHEKISSQIISDYKKANNRIIFLDYDGTLVPFTKYPELATIDSNTIELINSLSNNPKNHIVIISGRNKEFLEQQFNLVNVSIVAEHGYFIKRRNKDWEITVHADENWKQTILPIMSEYVNRCNGTFLEEKAGSVAWHYRNANFDYAQLRLHELRDELAEIIRHKTDFEILEGNKVMEVKCGRYNKGQAALTIIGNDKYDFMLAAGDDVTDESLFKALPEWAYTIKVGLSVSNAKYNVLNISSLLKLLKELED